MRHFTRLSLVPILIAICVVVVYPIAAQDRPELPYTYTSTDGSFSFRYPAGWSYVIDEWYSPPFMWNGPFDENPLSNNVQPDYVHVIAFSPSNVADEIPQYISENPDYRVLINEFFGTSDEIGVSTQNEILNDRPATIVSLYSEDEVMGEIILIELESGETAVLIAHSRPGHYEMHRLTVEAIAISMQQHNYEEGSVRPYVVSDFNVQFDIPADFYALYDGEAYIFGTPRPVINDEAPLTGEMFGAIVSPDLFEGEFGRIELSIESFDRLVDVVFHSNFTIITPPELIEYTESPIKRRAQTTVAQVDLEIVLTLVELQNGQLIIFTFTVLPGEMPDFEDVIEQVVNSLQPLAADDDE